jgi:uncharacterized protein YjbI with pentapeptide repeats
MQKYFFMQFIFLTQLIKFVILEARNEALWRLKMETLTYFIENLFNEELGSECFQIVENKSISDCNYKDIVVSGSRIESVIFENVIFENCTFWSSNLSNCLFINCIFINCKFQFTDFTNCNFESSSFENCIWGLSKLQGAESLINSDLTGNYSFESIIPNENTCSLNLAEFLICA